MMKNWEGSLRFEVLRVRVAGSDCTIALSGGASTINGSLNSKLPDVTGAVPCLIFLYIAQVSQPCDTHATTRAQGFAHRVA